MILFATCSGGKPDSRLDGFMADLCGEPTACTTKDARGDSNPNDQDAQLTGSASNMSVLQLKMDEHLKYNTYP